MVKQNYWLVAIVQQALLALPGIGAETADAILTYAFRMPSFVLATYNGGSWSGSVTASRQTRNDGHF